ncbi:MAG: hypothetical protein ACOYN0_13140 [Phycisphaerales bacterium]
MGASSREVRVRREVAQENHAAQRAAQSLPDDDLRTVFAVDVARALQGGRAAILTPERRRALVDGAGSRGMKPFEANLVIAMVQHAAREGEGAAAEPPRRRAPVAANSSPSASGLSAGVLFGITGLLAAAMFVVLRWVVAGE